MHRRSVVVIRRSQLIGANDRRVLFQCDRSRSRFRLAANVVSAAFLCVSLFHTLFFFFLFQLRTMLFHLHSLFTSRALHAYATVSICSTEFLFLPSLLFTRFLRFTVCPLCFFLSSRTPPSLFSQLSFDHAESRSPFPLPIFLKIFHLIRSQANQLCSKEIIGFSHDFRDQMFLSLNKCREKILYLH